jgi:hypothetical protein
MLPTKRIQSESAQTNYILAAKRLEIVYVLTCQDWMNCQHEKFLNLIFFCILKPCQPSLDEDQPFANP